MNPRSVPTCLAMNQFKPVPNLCTPLSPALCHRRARAFSVSHAQTSGCRLPAATTWASRAAASVTHSCSARPPSPFSRPLRMPIKATEMLSRLCRAVWVAQTGTVLAACLCLADFRAAQHHLGVFTTWSSTALTSFSKSSRSAGTEGLLARGRGRTGPAELAVAMPVLRWEAESRHSSQKWGGQRRGCSSSGRVLW